MPTRLLTLTEFAVWFRIDRRTVRRMLANGQLTGINTPAGWRIPDIGLELFERARQRYTSLPEIAYIRGVEVAELLDVSERWVRRLAEDGHLPCRLVHGRRLYSLQAVLDAANRRMPRRTQHHRHARPLVMNWAKRRLAESLPLDRERSWSSPFPDRTESERQGQLDRMRWPQ